MIYARGRRGVGVPERLGLAATDEDFGQHERKGPGDDETNHQVIEDAEAFLNEENTAVEVEHAELHHEVHRLLNDDLGVIRLSGN